MRAHVPACEGHDGARPRAVPSVQGHFEVVSRLKGMAACSLDPMYVPPLLATKDKDKGGKDKDGGGGSKENSKANSPNNSQAPSGPPALKRKASSSWSVVVVVVVGRRRRRRRSSSSVVVVVVVAAPPLESSLLTPPPICGRPALVQEGVVCAAGEGGGNAQGHQRDQAAGRQ